MIKILFDLHSLDQIFKSSRRFDINLLGKCKFANSECSSEASLIHRLAAPIHVESFFITSLLLQL